MKEKIPVRKSDLARDLGISSKTVENYTKTGLLIPIKKSLGGYLYDIVENRKRFERIKELKDQGKTLKEIKEILDKGVST